MMRNETLGGYNTVNEFINAKLGRLNSSEHSFLSLFELMFSERENVLYEKSVGYKIEYTSYGEAYERVISLAGKIRFAVKRLPHDAVIGLYMDNDIDWLVSFWAILKSGYKPLLLNTRLSDSILTKALNTCGAKYILSKGKSIEGFEALELSELEAGECADCGDFGSEVILMSSGTTASPKLCAYSAEEFFHQINDSVGVLKQCEQIKKLYEGQIKLLAFLPFYHIFGLAAVYIWFAFFSRAFVHLADFSGQTILNTIRRHKVTHIFAVPMLWNEVYKQALKTIKGRGEETYNKFLKGMEIAERIGDVPVIGSAFIKSAFKEIRDNLFGDSISFMITGGSEIKPEVLRFFNSIGYRLCNGYGMTEIGITSVELSPKRSILNAGFVGKPMDSVEYAISEDGSLLVRGKSTAKYIMDEAGVHSLGDWYDTRDLAECVDGHYRILGRRDDLVIAESGENLNPCLIEPLLAGDGYQLCLIGAEENGKTVPTLLVYTGRHITAEKYSALRNELSQRLNANGLSAEIRKIELTAEPLIAEDDIKINRARLKKLCAEGKLELIRTEKLKSADSEDSKLIDYVRSLFAAALEIPLSEIGADTDFFLDCGGTSLDYFAMVSKLQEDYGVAFPTEGEKTLSTVRELSKFIEEARNNVD